MTTIRELFFFESEEDIRNLEHKVNTTFELLNRVNICFHSLGIGKLTDIRQLELAMENLEFVRKLIFEKKMCHPVHLEQDNQWLSTKLFSLNQAFEDYMAAVKLFKNHKRADDVDWDLFMLVDGCLYIDAKVLESRKESFRYYETSISRKKKIEVIENLIEAIEEVESLGLTAFTSFDSPVINHTNGGYRVNNEAVQ